MMSTQLRGNKLRVERQEKTYANLAWKKMGILIQMYSAEKTNPNIGMAVKRKSYCLWEC